MAKILSIASGSKGNCTYIGADSGAVMIDAGVSAARIAKTLDEHSLDPAGIRAIFVTHEHIDHIKGIKVFASRYSIPVYMTEGTRAACMKDGFFDNRVDIHTVGKCDIVGDFAVTSFHTMHDSNESCGYVIETPREKLAVCTDLGVVTDEVHNALCGCRAVVIESNHDINMLSRNPNYPMPLKRRIMSDKGHLSNNDCADEIYNLIQSGSVHFILAHLSEQNNTPTIAAGAVRTRMLIESLRENRDYTLNVSLPNSNGVVIV